jgi:tyrosine-specific transport protein
MKKSIGGAFLVVGTTIGAGMLSLPLITAACGLPTAILLTAISWSVMYYTGLKLIKVCAKQEVGVNYTSLIREKMPKSLQIIFTTVYLLLLYSLMAAYTTEGASLVHLVSQSQTRVVSLDAITFILLFGSLVLSTRLSDYINRSFVSVKLIFYTLCIICMLFFIKYSNLFTSPVSIYAIIFAWPTLLPAFGFQNMIPVLYEYQQGNVDAVKKSVFIGSFAVLIIYIIWLFVCLGVLTQQDYNTIYQQGNTLSSLIHTIKNSTESSSINTFLSVFINISVITSFICVGLSLYHYLKDTFKNIGIPINKISGYILTFTPPFIFTILYPKGFILALQYAAIFAVVVFVYTPIYLDKDSRLSLKSYYPIILGSLVIIAQITNLIGLTRPF